MLDLLGLQVCLAAQEPPEISVEEQLEEGKCGAVVVDVVTIFWGPMWSPWNCVSTRVTRSDQPLLRFSAGASSGSDSLDSEDVSSSEG